MSRMATAEPGRYPNDPGTTMAYVADEILADQRRAFIFSRMGGTLKVVDGNMSPQVLARYGHSPATIRAQADLLRKARKGNEAARRVLRERYGCTVWQRADLPRR